MQLVDEIYKLTRSLPKDEIYRLTSQIKRASVSIPCNIAEGIGRNYKRDTIQFLHISRGSLYEVETLLEITRMTALITEEKCKQLSELIEECLKILNGLIGYYEKSNLK